MIGYLYLEDKQRIFNIQCNEESTKNSNDYAELLINYFRH